MTEIEFKDILTNKLIQVAQQPEMRKEFEVAFAVNERSSRSIVLGQFV